MKIIGNIGNIDKIFESPDGGKTIYERPFGGAISERKLVERKPVKVYDTHNLEEIEEELAYLVDRVNIEKV